MTAPQPAPAAAPDGMAAAFESDCAAREAGFEAIRRDLAKRAPAPAAADARVGERVSVDAAALEHARACAIAYGAIPAGCDDIDEGCDLASAVAGLSATARPLPTAAGAVDLSALGEIRAVANTLGVCGSGTGATKMRQMANALRAACAALASATPAVPAPDRADFDRLLYTVVNTAACHALAKKRDEPGYRAKVNAAIADLTRLVFPDAPAPAPDAAGEAVRDG